MSIQSISNKLAIAGIEHILVMAADDDKIKVTTKLTFPKSSSLIVDEVEGTQLRGRGVLDNPTKTKIVNMYAKQIERSKIYHHFPQQRHLVNVFRFRIPGPAPKPGEKIFLSELGKNDTEIRMNVELVDSKTKKPVYSLEDIVSGTVEIVEVK